MDSYIHIHFSQDDDSRRDNRLRFCDDGMILDLNITCESQTHSEHLMVHRAEKLRNGPFYLLQSDQVLAGALVVSVDYPLKNQIFDIYRQLLEICAGWSIYRIWNYVPHINQERFGLENYKSFSQGRALAYEAVQGPEFEPHLGAASAVGVHHDYYALYFVAGRNPAKPVENPKQVAAFCYPPQYGPKPPSFARGTVVEHLGYKVGYLSGTASIRGYRTLGIGDIEQQIQVTKENMDLVFQQMGFEGGLKEANRLESFYKVYVRNPEHMALVKERTAQMLGAQDRVIYLIADICRSDLALEIEGVVRKKIKT